MSKTVQEIMEVMGKTAEASIALERKNGSSYTHIADINPEDINEARYYFDGALYRSVMRCLELKLKNNWTAKAKKGLFLDGFNIKVTHPEGDSVTIGYGGFYIAEEPEYDAAQNLTSIIAYDELYPSMQAYTESLWQSGITVKNYLIAILDKLGINYDTNSLSLMANADKVIASEKYLDVENDSTEAAYTYRDVLDEIAKAAGVTFAFRNSLSGDEYKLYAIKPTESGYIIDESNLRSVTIGAKYGPVKGVVLSREPQEDNVYYPSNLSSSQTAVKIANVEIMEDSNNDEYRKQFAKGIYDNVAGTEYYLYELDSFGMAFLNFGDIFTIKAADRENGVIGAEKSYKTIFMRTDMTIGCGIKEKSKLEAPQATSTDYSAAESASEKLLKKTMLKVDKQEQRITALAKESDDKYAELKLTAEGLDAEIANTKAGLEVKIAATAEAATSQYTSLKAEVKDNYVSNITYNTYVKQTAETLQMQADSIEQITAAGYISTDECKELISAEKGNITLAVERNLKIGARNILLDSACFKSFTPIQQSTAAAPVVLHMDGSTTPSGEYKVIGWKKNTTAGSGGVMFNSADILGQDENAIKKVKAGTKYTLSFWAKVEEDSPEFSIVKSSIVYTGKGVTYDDSRCEYVKDSDGNIALSANEWRKVVIVFTIGSGFSDSSGAFCLRFLTKSTEKVSLDISSFKLEEGNIATDWSPSSEDIDQSVKAQISMCVTKDKNNNLTSEINISGDLLTINTDNFTLDKTGKMTCAGAEIVGGKIVCGVEGQSMIIAAGAIKHSFGGNNIGGIGVTMVPTTEVEWYETVEGVDGIALNVQDGCAAWLNKDSFDLYHQSGDTSEMWFKASEGEILIHGKTTVTLGDTETWSAGIYSAATRSMLSSNVSLVIDASDSMHQYPIYLCGESIVFLGKLFFDNYKNTGSGTGTLKVNYSTGEIYAT